MSEFDILEKRITDGVLISKARQAISQANLDADIADEIEVLAYQKTQSTSNTQVVPEKIDNDFTKEIADLEKDFAEEIADGRSNETKDDSKLPHWCPDNFVAEVRTMLQSWIVDYKLPVPDAVVFCYGQRIELLYNQMRISQLGGNLWRVGYWYTKPDAVTPNDIDITVLTLQLPEFFDKIMPHIRSSQQ